MDEKLRLGILLASLIRPMMLGREVALYVNMPIGSGGPMRAKVNAVILDVGLDDKLCVQLGPVQRTGEIKFNPDWYDWDEIEELIPLRASDAGSAQL